MIEKEKHIGEAKMTEQPKKPFTFTIKDNAITGSKIASGAVSWDKLSDDLKAKMDMMVPTITLGFYTDEEDPAPLLAISIRPENINQTIVPYLMMAQQDISSSVIEWKWERDSGNPAMDEAWNSQPKAWNRRITLTGEDFPTGWTDEGSKLSFRCAASFHYDEGIQVLMNVVTIV